MLPDSSTAPSEKTQTRTNCYSFLFEVIVVSYHSTLVADSSMIYRYIYRYRRTELTHWWCHEVSHFLNFSEISASQLGFFNATLYIIHLSSFIPPTGLILIYDSSVNMHSSKYHMYCCVIHEVWYYISAAVGREVAEADRKQPDRNRGRFWQRRRIKGTQL